MEQILELINEMSPYLLLGFLLAGLMHAFIPGTLYSRYLSGSKFKSVLNAALLGIPIPLCSCGVIPTAMSIRREGASKGAAVSFLIATPQTGVDSIMATYSLMGLPFAIVRPVVALITALFGGQMVNFVEGDDKEGDELTHKKQQRTDHLSKLTFTQKLIEALRYAYLEMMEDIGKWLVIGIVVAGLITVFVPTEFFQAFQGNTLLSMLLVLCIAIPMYTCATGSIPIAVALMLKGLTPGSALVLLMAGPAANMASILVINKVLGIRTLITYLTSIIGGAVLGGIVIDQILPIDWFLPKMMSSDACCEEPTSWFNIGCSILLGILLLYALVNHYFHPHSCTCGCEHDNSCTCGCNCEQEDQHTHDEKHGACSCGCDENDCKQYTFKIKGMTCSHCRSAAVGALESVAGVENVSVDLSSGKAVVEGNVSMQMLRDAIDHAGFTIVE